MGKKAIHPYDKDFQCASRHRIVYNILWHPQTWTTTISPSTAPYASQLCRHCDHRQCPRELHTRSSLAHGLIHTYTKYHLPRAYIVVQQLTNSYYYGSPVDNVSPVCTQPVLVQWWEIKWSRQVDRELPLPKRVVHPGVHHLSYDLLPQTRFSIGGPVLHYIFPILQLIRIQMLGRAKSIEKFSAPPNTGLLAKYLSIEWSIKNLKGVPSK